MHGPVVACVPGTRHGLDGWLLAGNQEAQGQAYDFFQWTSEVHLSGQGLNKANQIRLLQVLPKIAMKMLKTVSPGLPVHQQEYLADGRHTYKDNATNRHSRRKTGKATNHHPLLEGVCPFTSSIGIEYLKMMNAGLAFIGVFPDDFFVAGHLGQLGLAR